MYFVLIVAILFASLAPAQEQPPQQTPDPQQQTQTAPRPESQAKPEPEPQAAQPPSPQAQPQSPEVQQDSKQVAPKPPQAEGEKAKPQAKKRPARKPTTQHAVRKSKSRKHTATAHAKPTPTKDTQPASSTSTDKVVVRNGGARDMSVDLAPKLSKEQAQQERESAAVLIGKTENNLKVLEGRQLNKAQQGMLEQIRAYLQQAKSASDSGDVVRANTLAFKAQLLSEDLLKN